MTAIVRLSGCPPIQTHGLISKAILLLVNLSIEAVFSELSDNQPRDLRMRVGDELSQIIINKRRDDLEELDHMFYLPPRN